MSEKSTSRAAIIEAAAMLIRKYGVQGMSLAQVVAESGTSVGAIYHHFSGKNAIVVEVAKTAIAIPMGALAEWLDKPASPAQLASYAMGALELAPHLGELMAQLGAGAITDDELGHQLQAEFSVLRDAVDETMQAWARLNDVAPARIEGYSQLLVGLTLGYASQRVLVRGFDERAYLKQAVALLRLPEESVHVGSR